MRVCMCVQGKPGPDLPLGSVLLSPSLVFEAEWQEGAYVHTHLDNQSLSLDKQFQINRCIPIEKLK